MKGIYALFAILLLVSCSTTSNSEIASENSRVDTAKEKQVSDRIIKSKPADEDPYRKLAGMDIGEEKIYYATDTLTNYDYQLVLKKISPDSLKFRLTATDENGEIKSIFGKLAKRDKRRDKIQRRFGTSLPILVYTLSSKETSTELVIDKERAEFIRFDYFINSNGASTWNETDPLKVGVKNLLLQVSDPYEDYEAYFHKMIEKTIQSHAEIVGKDSTSRNYKSNLSTYQSDISTTSKLLNDYDKASTEYVLSRDSSLLNKIVYYKLDSIQRLMESKGIEFNIRILPKSEQSIPIEFQDYLVVDLLRNRKEGLNTEKFYKMEYSKNLRYGDLKFEVGLWKFYADKEDFVQYNDSLYLGILNGFGFETVNHLLTLWKPQGDSLVLKEILNKVIGVGIGEVKVDKLIVTSSGDIVIIGSKMGGDEGYVWGSFWIGLRSKPSELNMILERKFEGSSENYEYTNHRFLNDSTLELETIMRKWENGKQIDSIEKVEIVDLIGLINGTLKLDEDIRCSREIMEETDRSIHELTSQKIDRFLQTISKKCNYNHEKSSYSNGILMLVFDRYPLEVAKLLTQENSYEFEEILRDLTEPSDPRVHIAGIIEKLNAAGFQGEKVDLIIEALQKGNEYLENQH